MLRLGGIGLTPAKIRSKKDGSLRPNSDGMGVSVVVESVTSCDNGLGVGRLVDISEGAEPG